MLSFSGDAAGRGGRFWAVALAKGEGPGRGAAPMTERGSPRLDAIGAQKETAVFCGGAGCKAADVKGSCRGVVGSSMGHRIAGQRRSNESI